MLVLRPPRKGIGNAAPAREPHFLCLRRGKPIAKSQNDETGFAAYLRRKRPIAIGDAVQANTRLCGGGLDEVQRRTSDWKGRGPSSGLRPVHLQAGCYGDGFGSAAGCRTLLLTRTSHARSESDPTECAHPGGGVASTARARAPGDRACLRGSPERRGDRKALAGGPVSAPELEMADLQRGAVMTARDLGCLGGRMPVPPNASTHQAGQRIEHGQEFAAYAKPPRPLNICGTTEVHHGKTATHPPGR